MYGILLIPVVLASMGLAGFGFFFKSGSAGFGILIALFIYFKEKPKEVWAIVAAFGFSIIGDWFLSIRNDEVDLFVTGIGFFFLAHLGYLGYAMFNGRMKKKFTGIFTAVFLGYYFLVLFPSIDDLMLNVAVLVYLLISCLSFGIAMGFEGKPAVRQAYIFGIFLVLFSDTIISLKEFVGWHVLDWLILPTYYLAHISVTFALMQKSETFGKQKYTQQDSNL